MNMQYGNERTVTQQNAYGAAAQIAGETIASARMMTRKSRQENPPAKRDGAPRHSRPQLLYQPRIDMSSGKIVGAEARIHWSQPGHTMLSGRAPTSRLGCLAMERAMSEWAVRKACIQANSMNREQLPAVRTSIRFSARQLMDPRLEGYLREAISDAAIGPELIECGVSETTLLENPQGLTPILRKLADTGVRIAVSDFGSDRSGLSYPNHFPVNAIWVDHSFFWRFVNGAGTTKIVTAILAMAARQGLSTVACGVQNPNQMMVLYQKGCRVMQGNFLCRPLPLDSLKTALREMGSAAP